MAETDPQKLRTGFTTGACATAAAKAALQFWHEKTLPKRIEITLPKDGKIVGFEIADGKPIGDDGAGGAEGAEISIIKDAGDDPDITHGARISSKIIIKPKSQTDIQVNFFAGEGVGTVTKAGLPLAVGEPAINPVPRKMITSHLIETALALGIDADFDVTISVENGAALAEKTWNPRLGIIGGLSILGTSGIVRPYSCAAWIHSIHRGIDVARAMGLTHIAGSTGNLSEAAVRKYYGLDLHSLMDMGDFASGMLKYLIKHPVARLTIAGGFGKILKLAAGHGDLHSKRAQIDFNQIADWARDFGLAETINGQIANAHSAHHIWQILENHQATDFINDIAARAKITAEQIYSRGEMNPASHEGGGTTKADFDSEPATKPNAKPAMIIDIFIINRAGKRIYPL